MKTIWEVLMVVTIAVVVTGLIVTMGEEVFLKQTLTDESVNDLGAYSALVSDYNESYFDRLNDTEVDPYKETDLNQVSEFVQEYRTYKGRLDQLNEGLKLIYRLPDLILYAVPYVDVSDLNEYANIYRLMVWILILIVAILGIKNGQLLPQF